MSITGPSRGSNLQRANTNNSKPEKPITNNQLQSLAIKLENKETLSKKDTRTLSLLLNPKAPLKSNILTSGNFRQDNFLSRIAKCADQIEGDSQKIRKSLNERVENQLNSKTPLRDMVSDLNPISALPLRGTGKLCDGGLKFHGDMITVDVKQITSGFKTETVGGEEETNPMTGTDYLQNVVGICLRGVIALIPITVGLVVQLADGMNSNFVGKSQDKIAAKNNLQEAKETLSTDSSSPTAI